MSPSLRGSGLKSSSDFGAVAEEVSLFTREWIEIELNELRCAEFAMSPSLRGSGLKSSSDFGAVAEEGLPLYEGVD